MSFVDICLRMRASGTCQESSCTFSHSFRTCDPCGAIFSNAADYDVHSRSTVHVNKVGGESAIYQCPWCNTKSMGRKNWFSHCRGKRHVEQTSLQGASPYVVEPIIMDSVPNHRYCTSCNVHILNSHWNSHARKALHLAKEQYAAFKVVLEDAEKDKHGVTVTQEFDFGILEVSEATKGITKTGVVSASVPSARIKIIELKLASAKGVTSSSPFAVKLVGTQLGLTTVKPVTFTVSFCDRHIGRFEDRLDIILEDELLHTAFAISRPIQAIIGSKADHELLRPTAPYKPQRRTQRQPETNVVEGVRPPSLKAIPYVVPLPHAHIPNSLAMALSTGSLAEIISRLRRVYLPATVDCQSYARLFKHLLWVEEFKMERDLEHYDITDATLTTYGPNYYLKVPGLAEKRPSVLVGDRILVQPHGSAPGHWFEGGVHVVRKDEVGLRFHASFRGWYKEKRYNVAFKLNRYPVRRQHQALDTAFSQDRILFPMTTHLPRRPYPRPAVARLVCFNPLIASNPPQLQAVVSIVKRAPGAVPFVVFGPPGTGKTITIVEAIRQVLKADPDARVLACAPSNSAADLIASRLTSLSTADLFRFYAPSRFKDQVPDEILEYTHARADGHFSVPTMARMKRFRVVVTTCVSASVVSGIGIPRGHYSHIFLDEAGQATEPEAMIAIKSMASNTTNIVLSGDPKQLGPIIRSSIAQKLGLETSFIERLMSREIYDAQIGYGTSVVKLVKNFRSHEAILQFPNLQFYGGDLQPCADTRITNAYLGSSYLPSKQFPIVFHAIKGKDLRESSSPSFFNIDEVTQVKSYVQLLREDRRFRTGDKDIGIITPYHAQCQKIRTALHAVADGIKVGSVEEFQGQERPVIIISTVRSSKEFVEYDLRHTLGFVANPRRFNVAVTRAKALLIIIGDPQVLSLDPLWRSFLNYIFQNKGWIGPSITWDPKAIVDITGGYDQQIRDTAREDMNDFARQMEALTLTGASGEDEDDNVVDRPWRDVE